MSDIAVCAQTRSNGLERMGTNLDASSFAGNAAGPRFLVVFPMGCHVYAEAPVVLGCKGRPNEASKHLMEWKSYKGDIIRQRGKTGTRWFHIDGLLACTDSSCS